MQENYKNSECYWFDLLDIEFEDRLSRKPRLFTDIINSLDNKIKYIIIDEIQKLPGLLDLVHQYLHENPGRYFFILAGSSARKLKSGGANLLAGRAFVYNLFLLTFHELDTHFSLDDYLRNGGLPGLFSFAGQEDKNRFLKAYALMFLKEEVWSEHLIKKLDPFRHFLEVAAQMNGDIINMSKIARQTGVTSKTIEVYYEILQETLLGILLDPYHSSVRKRVIHSPKFYFIDTGIKRALDNTLTVDLAEGTYAYGRTFEHFIITQIYFLNQYREASYKLFYLKTKDGAEIDLVIEKPYKTLILVEIKSTVRVDEIDHSVLKKFKNDLGHSQAYCFSNDPLERKKDGIFFVHWKTGIRKLFHLK